MTTTTHDGHYGVDFGQMNRELLAEKMYDAWKLHTAKPDASGAPTWLIFRDLPGVKVAWVAAADVAIAELTEE